MSYVFVDSPQYNNEGWIISKRQNEDHTQFPNPKYLRKLALKTTSLNFQLYMMYYDMMFSVLHSFMLLN